MTPTDRDATDRVREALVAALAVTPFPQLGHLANTLGVQFRDHRPAEVVVADALLRAECGADTARVAVTDAMVWAMVDAEDKTIGFERCKHMLLAALSAEASRDQSTPPTYADTAIARAHFRSIP